MVRIRQCQTGCFASPGSPFIRRIFGMVMEWAAMYEDELLQAWNDATHQRP